MSQPFTCGRCASLLRFCMCDNPILLDVFGYLAQGAALEDVEHALQKYRKSNAIRGEKIKKLEAENQELRSQLASVRQRENQESE